MPILLSIQAISGTYPDNAKNLEKYFFKIITGLLFSDSREEFN